MYHDDDANHAESEAPEMTADAVAGDPPQDEARPMTRWPNSARPDLKASFLGEIARRCARPRSRSATGSRAP
jgi:hypothetical protein